MLVLLDRDGVINQDAPEGILRIEDFHIFPQALEAIALFTKAGFDIAICTNQSAIGRGHLTESALNQMHELLRTHAAASGGKIAAFYVAPEAPEAATHRRKPGPGMLLEALKRFNANATDTYMVGDMLRDMEAAHAAGCKKILVRTGKGSHTESKGIPEHVKPVAIVDNLLEAAKVITACV